MSVPAVSVWSISRMKLYSHHIFLSPITQIHLRMKPHHCKSQAPAFAQAACFFSVQHLNCSIWEVGSWGSLSPSKFVSLSDCSLSGAFKCEAANSKSCRIWAFSGATCFANKLEMLKAPPCCCSEMHLKDFSKTPPFTFQGQRQIQ